MLNLQPTAPPAHETPVKRTKNNHQEPLTAESDLPPTRSLADLDPELLFHNFAQLVQVSQDEEAFEDDFEDEVARSLDYDHPHTLRLDFEPKTSSMKKKPLPQPS